MTSPDPEPLLRHQDDEKKVFHRWEVFLLKRQIDERLFRHSDLGLRLYPDSQIPIRWNKLGRFSTKNNNISYWNCMCYIILKICHIFWKHFSFCQIKHWCSCRHKIIGPLPMKNDFIYWQSVINFEKIPYQSILWLESNLTVKAVSVSGRIPGHLRLHRILPSYPYRCTARLSAIRKWRTPWK